MEQDTRQAILDKEHLRLLSFFYYISAGITALFACIPILHMLLGIMFIFAGKTLEASIASEPPPLS